MSRLFSHPTLGTIGIEFRRNSRSVTARWRDNRVHVIAPLSLSGEQIFQAINNMAPQLLASRPATHENLLDDGRRIEFYGVTIIITRQSARPDRIYAYPRLSEVSIAIGSALDPSSPSTLTAVRRLLTRVGTNIAERIVLPRAVEIAGTLHLTPSRWRIGHGRSTLGTCSSAKFITLSGRLTFYPSALRDYVVCHELAHMSEMNHSPRFHQLCDTYCRAILSTPETVLEKELKRYTRSLSGDLF